MVLGNAPHDDAVERCLVVLEVAPGVFKLRLVDGRDEAGKLAEEWRVSRGREIDA